MLYGGAGNDTMNGEQGNDTVYGGLGNDLFYFTNSSGGHDYIDGGSGTDTLILTEGKPMGMVSSWFTGGYVQLGNGNLIITSDGTINLGGGNSIDITGVERVNFGV